MSAQGQELLLMCCSEIAGGEGIPLCHMVPLWLPACCFCSLLVGMQLSSPACCCILCWRRSALVMSSLLWALLLQGCSSSPVPATSALSVGEALSTLLLLPHGQWPWGGKQAHQGHWSVLICSWSQIPLTSLARKPVIEAMAVFIGQWSFRRGCTAFEMGLKCKPVAQISICMI